MAPRQLDFTGKSGTVYRYMPLEDDRVSPMGGNYLYVRLAGPSATVVYAGETENLYKGHKDRWEEAKAAFGATHVFTRLNVAGAVRRAEKSDMVEQHVPPMNKGD
ncbi:hypothetical protein [Caulobacter sp. NIBR2454]|uniref:hypothetical protein n=1 Tax=Caulobacter sp. NIBR2454 TaxID=3015996 RepID=UPI0022B6ECC1|nr:hypothetical protein [Caulobacter sp. NIBR2454]